MTPAALLALLTAAAGASFLLSVAFTALAIPLARRAGYMDRPGAHKSHVQPTPYGGGAAIFLAAWVPIVGLTLVAVLVPQEWLADWCGETVRAYVGGLANRAGQTLMILAGGGVLFVLGLLDDLRPLPPWPKLLIIAGVAVSVSSLGGVRLAEFAGPAGSVALTTLWIIVVANAFNFLDNMDGLSAGVAAVCALCLIACGALAGQVLIPALGCVFFGAILGFLCFNFPPARIFMGDAGSLLIGYMLAVLSVRTTYYESGGGEPPYALAMPLVILAIPLYDFASVVMIRLWEGRNPLKGDQRHFSHRLVQRGLSRRAAVLTIYLATAATGLCATLLPKADLRTAATVTAVVVLVLAIVAILEMPLRKQG